MSLSHETMLELMSLADGELEGSDRERIERLVASDDEARRALAALRDVEVGSWLADSMDRQASASGADGVADAVMAAIGSGASAAHGTVSNGAAQAGVVSIGRARARKSPRLPLVASAAAGVIALAAGVAIYLHAGTQTLDAHAPVASVRVPPVDVEAPSAALAQQGAGGGVEVNEIDAPSRGVSVFEIPAGAAAAAARPSGASSVVVWVEDDPGPK